MKRTLIIAFIALLLPSALLAQEPATEAPAAPTPDDVRGWLQELQQIQAQLQQIQQKTLEERPELQAAQEEVAVEIRATMEEVDPTISETMAQAEALEQKAIAAQQAGDQAQLQALGAEAQQIQQKLVAAQQEAFAQPELAAEVEAFQARMERAMVEVAPESAQLIQRMKTLQERLAATMGQAPPQ